jgi:hypothetical protein
VIHLAAFRAQSRDGREEETFMRGDQKVIEQLNLALSGELTAIFTGR